MSVLTNKEALENEAEKTKDGGGGFGIELMLGAFAKHEEKLDHINRSLKVINPVPIHRIVFGSSVAPVTRTPQPLLVLTKSMAQGPSKGRLWNLRSIGIFSPDPHTNPDNNGVATNPVTASWLATAGGTATLPAGASITGFTFSIYPGAGATTSTITIAGVAGGPLVIDVPLPAASVPVQSFTFPQPLVAASAATSITVTFAGVANSGAGNLIVYGQNGLNSLNVIADLYAGAPPLEGAGQVGLPYTLNLFDSIGSVSFPQPYTDFSRHVVWCRPGEIPYMLVYNPQPGATYTIVARVEEWIINDAEAISA